MSHINLDLHLGIGLCLSLHPSNAIFVATYPVAKQTPKSTNLTIAIGKQITILISSYNPSISGVSFLNGSNVDGAGTDNPSDPINSNGLREEVLGFGLWLLDCWMEESES